MTPTAPILMRKVGSDHVRLAGYSPERHTLRVRFPDKPRDVTYEYHGVTQELADEFFRAPSKGSFVQRVLRGKFLTFKLSSYWQCIRCTPEDDHPVAYHVEVRRVTLGAGEADRELPVAIGIVCEKHADELQARTLRPELVQYLIPLAEVCEDA